MMTRLFIGLFLIIFKTIIAQVGINVNNPKSTLDIRKNTSSTLAEGLLIPRISADSLQLKDTSYGVLQDGILVFATKAVNPAIASLKTANIKSRGYYMYDAYYTHPNSTTGVWKKMNSSLGSHTAYAGKLDGGLSLANINILNFDSWEILQFGNKPPVVGSQLTNDSYIVPETGLYQIAYNFQYGNGVQASLISAPLKMGIIKTSITSANTLLDNKTFTGVNLALVANITITNGDLNGIYHLEAGEKISFAIRKVGILTLDLLTTSKASAFIYKISD